MAAELAFTYSQSDSDSDFYLRGMSRLLETVQQLSLARTLPDIQRIVRTAARQLAGCDGATFVLRDGDKCHYADEDAIAPLWKGSRFPMKMCISGWSMLNRQPAVIGDIYQDERIPHEAYRPTFVKSLVMVPIRQLDPIGAIGVYWAKHHQPTTEEVSLMQALADSTSIAMENVQVYMELEQRVRDRTAELEKANAEIQHLSFSDELTGLYNRRGFLTLAKQMLKEGRRHNSQCMLAFVDVNGLKRVNDELGHDMGDQLIMDVADVLRSTLRDSDIIARMGGDEFCIMAVDPHVNEEKLQQRIQAEFEARNSEASRPYPISASIGIASASIDADTVLENLILLADKRMYEQKKAAGNARLD